MTRISQSPKARSRPFASDLAAVLPGVWGWTCCCLPAVLPCGIQSSFTHQDDPCAPVYNFQVRSCKHQVASSCIRLHQVATGCIRLGWTAACSACTAPCTEWGLHLTSTTQCTATTTSPYSGFLQFQRLHLQALTPDQQTYELRHLSPL